MRTIKFRAWGFREKHIFPWDWVMGQEFPFLGQGDLGEEAGIFAQPVNYELMQFTGLLDKNGKEIYEGDILANELWSGPVGFFNGEFGIQFGNKKYIRGIKSRCLYGPKHQRMEVIGNIHENPELMRE